MSLLSWLKRRPTRWSHLTGVPLHRLVVLLLAVFLLFTTPAFYYDLMHGGVLPYAVVLAQAAVSGLDAVAWILALARLPLYWVFLLGAAQFLMGSLQYMIADWTFRLFHPAYLPSATGIHFAATASLIAVIASYMCFVQHMRIAGREALRLRAELDLAHSIQKTLVPLVERSTRCYEIFGISQPSEKVGGDLVDVVELRGGDMVAYLADIAGHGLQAGILMGMLKTAARTALLDEGCGPGGGPLAMLMERLNRVLPGVKEPHMYATFTALRLNADGQSFYGMAASPPLLHWSAEERKVGKIEEKQFPLGLLPVSGFTASSLAMKPGDVVLIATDGVLEVCSSKAADKNAEFGTDALEALLMGGIEMPLARLATSILESVRAYGKQVDDQTLLLVRRTAV